MPINALVVEDLYGIRPEHVDALEKLGCSVDDAESYPTAADKIKSGEKYQLLLCDTTLGDIPHNIFGTDVAEVFHKCNPDGVIIAMSSVPRKEECWKNTNYKYFIDKWKMYEDSLREIIEKEFK